MVTATATKAARTPRAAKTAPVSLPKRANQSVGGVKDVAAESSLKGKKVLVAKVTDKDRRAEIEQDLRKISRETGAKRVSQIEAERNAKLATPKPVGHLAAGLDGRNSPHSAKAVQDNRAAARKGEPAPKPAVAKKEARKAAKAATAAPKADDQRKITIVKKDFAFGREGTARRSSWDICLKAKTAAEYIAKGGAAKYLPRWVSAGAIKLA